MYFELSHKNTTACCERLYRGHRQDGRKSPNSCCLNTFINTGIVAPNYHQMDETERSVIAFFNHTTNMALGIVMLVGLSLSPAFQSTVEYLNNRDGLKGFPFIFALAILSPQRMNPNEFFP